MKIACGYGIIYKQKETKERSIAMSDFSCIYGDIYGDCHNKEKDVPFCQREFLCEYFEDCEYCTEKDHCERKAYNARCCDEAY